MIAARPDLLVIGALTIDRFADGSSVPGGSVLHIARAASSRGVRVAVITASGPEPEARTGMAELRELPVALESTDSDWTATFDHHDAPQSRRLRLEHLGGAVRVGGSALVAGAEVVLVAPIAGDVSPDELSLLEAVPIRAAILQGWLRSLDPGADVRPLPIRAVAPAAIHALSRFDLLVASREDLQAESGDPREQLGALRRALGGGPRLVVTDGAAGLWYEADGSTRHLAVPRRVDVASTVGAGDILAAFLAIGDPHATLARRARDAMEIVVTVLEGRA